MKARTMRRGVFLVLFAMGGATASAQEPTPAHRQWIEEEVPYIISEREEEVFRALQNTLERDRFIEAFWRKRDPVPGSPVNEFREEHYRRLDHANRELRGAAFTPGWRTDRGRMYIVLGPPRGIETFEFHNNLHDTQLWFYQGDQSRSLPSFFHLIFFRRQEAAQYRLFVPGADVPGDLLRGPARSFPERDMEQLAQISPELARAALAMDASEPVDFIGGNVGLGSEAVLARIESSPTLAIRNDDLDAWERYRDRVSAEYSFNFVPSEAAFAVLFGPDGTPYLHFSVELDLEYFAMDRTRDGSRAFTTLDATLEITDPAGRLILSDERESFVGLTASQLESVGQATFAYQDGVPLIPGDHEVTVILRNRVSSQYTVAEASLTAPETDPGVPGLGDLVVGFRTEAMPGASPDAFLTFQSGPTRIHAAPGGVFPAGATAHGALQVLSAPPSHELHFALLREDGLAVAEQTRPAPEGGPVFVSQPVPLDGVAPGRYRLRAQLRDASGETIAETASPLVVSPRGSIPRAGVFARRSFDTTRPALLATALGDQYWALDRFEEAEELFRRAVAADDPEAPQAEWKLAASHLRAGRAEAALALLLPLQYAHGDRYEVAVGLGLGFYLKGNHRAAADHLEKAASLGPAPPAVLNALGDTWTSLDQPVNAARAFRRSLEIDPEQPRIRERLVALGSETPPDDD